ncbi:MAG: ATP-grasp domain-containing protein [Lachnospiraceae bacterium]|nr:ATP-grasp domain-containing protein [Lachnospiraceae bacterium]
MEKILILNGGYSEVPLIRAARAQGFYVLVTGKNENAVGNRLADQYISQDYSDREGIYELARSQNVSAICSACNDFAYLSAAYACEKLHLPGHDSYQTALTLHHKDLYRAFAKRVGIPVPEVVECRGESDLQKVGSLCFPVIVKPVDLFGGMGMRKCHDMGEVREAFRAALEESRMAHVLVEEFLEGTNHGFTAMIHGGKVVFSMLDREYHEHSPFAVSAASVPEPVPEGVVRDLKGQVERMADGLKLCDGLVHSQFILTEERKPVIIEVCRRSPGDLYIDFVKYATGVDYPGMILSCEAGRGLDAWLDDSGCIAGTASGENGPGGRQGCQFPRVKGFWGRHVVVCKRAGKLRNVAIGDGLTPYIRGEAIAFEGGREMQENEAYKCGVLFLEFQSQEEMETIMKRASEYIEYEMEE